jgi:carboxyvinyl-carboxyphosphonate phosphorylmutase
MHWSNRRKKFRALLESKKCYHPASIFDAMSGRIAQDLGFECGMYAGSNSTLAILGAPDVMVMTLTEFAQQALRINRAIDMPVICEADTGYGNALNVRRTVEEMETAGIACINIEDSVVPRPYGPAGDKLQLISVEEGVGKIKAALDARQDKSLVISGRTRALAATTLKDAVARCKAYEKAGADSVFLTTMKTRKQLEAIRDAVKVPILLGSIDPDGELYDKVYLAKMGVRIALQGHQSIRGAVQGVYDTLKALRDGAHPKKLNIASNDLMAKVTREKDYDRFVKDYLGGA